MNIYAKKGHKVRFVGCSESQRQWGGHDDPTGILVEGETYTVEKTVVHSSRTEVFLEGIAGKEFNSVCFVDA